MRVLRGRYSTSSNRALGEDLKNPATHAIPGMVWDRGLDQFRPVRRTPGRGTCPHEWGVTECRVCGMSK